MNKFELIGAAVLSFDSVSLKIVKHPYKLRWSSMSRCFLFRDFSFQLVILLMIN